jgi:hypothetical protein
MVLFFVQKLSGEVEDVVFVGAILVFGISSCGCFSFQNLAFADKMLTSVSVPRLLAGRTRVDGVESSFNLKL